MRTLSWKYVATLLVAAGFLFIAQGYFSPGTEAGKAEALLDIRVVDSQGQAVKGIKVTLQKEGQAETIALKKKLGSKARYKSVTVNAGTWTLVVTDPSGRYQTHTQTITLNPEDNRQVVVVLKTPPALSNIKGHVLNSDGDLVSTAVVEVKGDNLEVPGRTGVDEKGNFSFPNLPPGKYTLTANDPDGIYSETIFPTELKPGKSHFVEIPMVESGGNSIVVVAAQPKVDLDSASVGGTVDQTVLQETPLVSSNTNGRRYQAYAVKTAEAKKPAAQGNTYIHGLENDKVGTGFGGVTTRDPASGTFGGNLAMDVVSELEAQPNHSGHFNTESYEGPEENAFKRVLDHPLSTFSIDVDTASYANVRRLLNQGKLPPHAAVRVEEMVNYFDYRYTLPESSAPFSVQVETASCPWAPGHRLARIGLKGYELEPHEAPANNLVFLLDVSGSMRSHNKLPLVKQGMKKLLSTLRAEDRVAIVTYAGTSGLALESTPASHRGRIEQVIDGLGAGGSTNGAGGIMRAYQVARANFIEGGNNRIILATDGDFNVGTTDNGSLTDLVAREAKSGVFLSVLGFGMGNYKDSRLEKIADKANGNFAYIDSEREADKVLVREMTGTLFAIAKDVKLQIEFNPAQVSAYRLIGYENRILAKEDFNDDTKDAGEIGAGHTVTAIYEIVPFGVESDLPKVDPLKYQVTRREASESPELLTVKVRYKQPDGDKSRLQEFPVMDSGYGFSSASTDFRFATSVAGFAMVLKGSEYSGDLTFSQVKAMAADSIGADPYGDRREFLGLVERAQALSGQLTTSNGGVAITD